MHWHGSIFKTSKWLRARSIKKMERYTNRAAKHRFGKQRWKQLTTDIFTRKAWTYKSEACSTPNQRPPNPLHHDNALLSDLFINGTHDLRTQPCGSAWHSRHERTTRHTPAPEELLRKTTSTIHPVMEGCHNPAGRQLTQIGPLHPYKHCDLQHKKVKGKRLKGER